MVEELVLSAPLVIPASGGVQVQVVVGAGGDGRAPGGVGVFADSPTRFANGCCTPKGVLGVSPVQPATDLSVWPPLDATAVDVSDAYARLGERGYQYGPAFQGLQAMWRRGDGNLRRGRVARGHRSVASAGSGSTPHCWTRPCTRGRAKPRGRPDRAAVLLARGVAARRRRDRGCGSASHQPLKLVRCRSSWPTPPDAPVLSVRSLTTRPISTEQLHAALTGAGATDQRLLEVVWSPIPLSHTTTDYPDHPILSWNDFHTTADTADHTGAGGAVVVWELHSVGADVVGSVYAATHRALGVLQSWLAAGPGRACWWC